MAPIRLAWFGVGNMGMALLRTAIQAGVLSPAMTLVVELDEARRADATAMGCAVTADPLLARGHAALMFAVKPQSFASLAAALGPLTEPALVLSIMAGLSSSTIQAALGRAARVVRLMPNTPCLIGQGMTGIAPGEGAAPEDLLLAQRIADAAGRSIVIDESLMHAVTAISGSGPAYLFLVAEAMQAAAVSLGIPAEHAAEMVQQTLVGSSLLLQQSGRSPQELRSAVTSKGGTTEAAIRRLQEGNFESLFIQALTAARDRGRELDRP
jgi:pyrroline-5-carboxylate reductase